MIRRKTQTANYWQKEYSPSAEDVGALYSLLLDGAESASTATLVQALIDRRCSQEEKRIRAELGRGRVFQPKDSYTIGDQVIFPALDLALGTIVGTRPGSSPDLGAFTVIQVQFRNEPRPKEFASELIGEHALNRPAGDDDLLRGEELRSVSELCEAYGAAVESKLVPLLHQHGEFLLYRDQWVLRGLLAPITAGHLNLAEAVIEVRGMPLPASEFVGELDLPAEIPEALRLLSVNWALNSDPRFDNVGDSGRDVWYLRRLVPAAVLSTPRRLVPADEVYDPREVAAELREVQRDIDDEWDADSPSASGRTVYKAAIRLSYPHWRCGTLPLTQRTRALFPKSTAEHSPVVLIDGQTGERMQGWVVPQGAYVYGVEAFYKRHSLPVGATIKLERTRDPRVITVDIVPQRLKPMWIRIATVQDGRLVFQMRKLPMSCEYDELLSIGEDEPDRFDRLFDEVQRIGEGLYEVLLRIVPELVKLSPEGAVHAKTIYSAANLLERVPPGAVFALLSSDPVFVSKGGGYWTLDEAQIPRQAN